MSLVIDYIANLGLDAVKEKVADSSDETQIKEHIADYLEQERKINELISREEEIDFGGLIEYIKSDLTDDVKLRLFGEEDERRLARNRILAKSASYASAHTKFSVKRTEKIVSTVVDILADYYRRKINRDLLFITRELEETSADEHEKTRNFMAAQCEQLHSAFQEQSTLSVDRSLQLIKQGDVKQVAENLGTFIDSISASHVLFPDFGFRMNKGNQLVSVALNSAALKKYPPHIKMEVSEAKMGNQALSEINAFVLEKSYRHQFPIYFDIINAKKYLGDVLDPMQTETENMKGGKAVVYPPKFPNAFPCCVCIEGETVVPYLLLRTKEILDDGTLIVTNEEQKKCPFDVSITISFVTKRTTFSIISQTPTSQEYLNYRKFMKKAASGKKITVFSLEQNEMLFQGVTDRTELPFIDDEIDFFEKIVAIEKYYDTSIIVPDFITCGENDLIDRLYNTIYNRYVGKATKISFDFVLSEENRKNILTCGEQELYLSYVGEATFNLFDTQYTLPIVRKMENMQIENLSRLKQKVEVLDVGDPFKISLIPFGDNQEIIYTDVVRKQKTAEPNNSSTPN